MPKEADEERLYAYLMEKVAHTGNYEALSNAAMNIDTSRLTSKAECRKLLRKLRLFL